MRRVSSSFAIALACLSCAALWPTVARADKVFINQRYPIEGQSGPLLSPPNIEATNGCATHVYVDSFVPHATIRVYLNGPQLIGNVTPQFGFVAVPLSHALHAGDRVTATQTVNGITSARSAPSVVGVMPSTLPGPAIDPHIYACARIVPVHNLVSSTTVSVKDTTANKVIGTGSTPNSWGNDWDPVFTPGLVQGHTLSATQNSCTGTHSPPAPGVQVLPEPNPVRPPTLEPPIIGNDAVTADGLYNGSLLRIFNHGAVLAGGFSTASSNWISVPAITAAMSIDANQSLCHHSAFSPPLRPTVTIPGPTLVSPICPRQAAAMVRNSTINATLVLLKNGAVAGYGGAAPTDVPVDLAPPNRFNQGDMVQIAEYLGNDVVLSNVVAVGCTGATTYHYDTLRTGWNSHETTLTPANVTAPAFRLLLSIPLDDQVDAEPLVVTNVPLSGSNPRTIVYVATENNTVYGIDPLSGAILQSRNLGTPVPESALPGQCDNNALRVGINSTPVIDTQSMTMYVVSQQYANNQSSHSVYALNLKTSGLIDKLPPVPVTGSHALLNGPPNSYGFSSIHARQRAALLADNGNLYAAFASFCDIEADQSRGWLLGWNGSSLAPLPANELTDGEAVENPSFFLSSIWMSGYGVSADSSGSLYFTTGNSDPGTDTYVGSPTFTNVTESAVKMKSDLSGILDLFTPANHFGLDQGDTDFGSGGLMVLPDQSGSIPHLAVAAGKDGRMFILNRDNMGGMHNPDVPAQVGIGGCWCGPSYYTGSDGVGRVVTSGGNNVETWTVNSSASPALSLEASSPSLSGAGDPGFLTSVSSNGTRADTAIIWAVSRFDSKANVSLYAFNASAAGGKLAQLYSATAGTWPNVSGNSNLVPTVANGLVYVASYKQLAIFGLGPPIKRAGRKAQATLLHPRPEPTAIPTLTTYWGTVERISGTRIEIRLRTGRLVQVDVAEAMRLSHTVPLVTGRAVRVRGMLSSDDLLQAQQVLRAKPDPRIWGADFVVKR